MEIVIALLFTMFWAFLAYSIASQREADIKFWVIMALIFGPLAIPFIFMSKKKHPQKQSTDKNGTMIA